MWQNPQKTADLVTFNEEILNKKTLFFVQLHAWNDPAYASAYHVTRFRNQPYFD